jgi:hypothetical protein
MKRNRHERPTIKFILFDLLETEIEITTVNLELHSLTDGGGKAHEEYYQCYVCGLEFEQEQYLGDHMQRHSEACSSRPVPTLLNLFV